MRHNVHFTYRQRWAAIVRMASDTNGHWAHGCRWWWWHYSKHWGPTDHRPTSLPGRTSNGRSSDCVCFCL